MNWNKARILVAAMGMIGLCSSVALAADISGNWQVQFQSGQFDQATPLCTLQQKDDTLTGACKGPHSQGQASGTVKGDKVDFTWTTPNGAFSFSGTLGADGSTISGTGTSPQGKQGTFTAKKQ